MQSKTSCEIFISNWKHFENKIIHMLHPTLKSTSNYDTSTSKKRILVWKMLIICQINSFSRCFLLRVSFCPMSIYHARSFTKNIVELLLSDKHNLIISVANIFECVVITIILEFDRVVYQKETIATDEGKRGSSRRWSITNISKSLWKIKLRTNRSVYGEKQLQNEKLLCFSMF